MKLEIVEITKLNKRSQELILIDFKVLLFLGIEQDENEMWFECMSESGSIIRQSIYVQAIFLKEHLPEIYYSQLVYVWNFAEKTKAK